MPPEISPLTVYFDGSCPLCRAEIALYRNHDTSAQLCFRDVSNADTPLEADISRTRAKERFHVRRDDGQLVSGAAAFVSIWRVLPRWRWAARVASTAGMVLVLEGCYQLFLPARPVLAWILGKFQSTARETGTAQVPPSSTVSKGVD